jgi:hypothetical protein
VREHKFASSLSADTGDVNFDFGHVEMQFRVLSKPSANLDHHLEGCFESGINVRIICESNPASTAVAGEYQTPDGVLRQTKTHHLQAIPLLTASCAFDVMRVPAVIRVTVGAGGAVHGFKVSEDLSAAATMRWCRYHLRMFLCVREFRLLKRSRHGPLQKQSTRKPARLTIL